MSLLSIRKSFFKGMNKVFKTLFTEVCAYHYLVSPEETENIYQERVIKEYGEPIFLSASVRTDFKKGDLPIEAVNVDCIITVPTQQMLDNGLIVESPPHLDVLNDLQKGKFVYNGIEFLISYVSFGTHIGDSFQFYKFYCYIAKKEDSHAENE